MTCRDDYRAEGAAFEQAWDELVDGGCEVPPSLEVFRHEMRLRAITNPVHCAQLVARNYSRVRWPSDSSSG